MSKKMMVSAAILAVAAGFASAAGTDGTVRFDSTSPYGGLNGGGEFTVSSIAGPNLFGTFQTFCVELNESLSPGTSYTFNINTAAVNGGVGGGNPDPLDSRTAALYEAFWNGTLANYDFDDSGDGGTNANLNRRNSAAALQAAIWEIEQERAIESTSSNADVVALANFYVDQLAAQLVGQGLGERVRILNMYRSTDGGNAQDILVLVPLPQAGALAGLGLAGLAIRRRR